MHMWLLTTGSLFKQAEKQQGNNAQKLKTYKYQTFKMFHSLFCLQLVSFVV